MPYIKQDFRDEIEDTTNFIRLVTYFVTVKNDQDACGMLNYIIYTLVRTRMIVKGKGYFFFAWVVGTLICAILEIYRRLVAPYEEEKIKENGDIL